MRWGVPAQVITILRVGLYASAMVDTTTGILEHYATTRIFMIFGHLLLFRRILTLQLLRTEMQPTKQLEWQLITGSQVLEEIYAFVRCTVCFVHRRMSVRHMQSLMM